MQHNNDNKDKKSRYKPKRIAKRVSESEFATQGISWVIGGAETFIPAIERIQSNLGFLSLFITALGFPIHLLNLIYGLVWSKENDLSRATRILFGFGGIALAAIGLVAAVGLITVAAPIIMMIGAAKGLVESVWRTGLSIYDRFFGQGAKDANEIKKIRAEIAQDANLLKDDDRINRLTMLTNRQRKRNGQIAEGFHVIAMNVVGTIAVGLLFGGVTSAAGTGILIGIGIYGGVDAVGLNPLRWAGRLANWTSKKIRGKPLFSPFSPKTPEDIKAELYNELNKNKSGTLTHSNASKKTMVSHNSETSILSTLQAQPASSPLTKAATQSVMPDSHPHLASFLDKKPVEKGKFQQVAAKQNEDETEGEGEGEGEGNHPNPKSNHH